jgi:hypothetical protein
MSNLAINKDDLTDRLYTVKEGGKVVKELKVRFSGAVPTIEIGTELETAANVKAIDDQPVVGRTYSLFTKIDKIEDNVKVSEEIELEYITTVNSITTITKVDIYFDPRCEDIVALPHLDFIGGASMELYGVKIGSSKTDDIINNGFAIANDLNNHTSCSVSGNNAGIQTIMLGIPGVTTKETKLKRVSKDLNNDLAIIDKRNLTSQFIKIPVTVFDKKPKTTTIVQTSFNGFDLRDNYSEPSDFIYVPLDF